MASVEKPAASILRRLPSARTRAFPSRADFVSALARGGYVQDEDDLLNNHPELISDVIFNWIAHGQTGCQFANFLARRPNDAGWLSIVELEPFDGRLATRVDQILLDSPAGDFQAVQFVFPRLQNPKEVASLVNELCNNPRWYARELPCDQNEHMLVQLRWRLPGGRHVSWVLGFAPFETMPFTRRAPFVTLILRNREPEMLTADRPKEGALEAVHLADVPHLLGSDEYRPSRYLAATQRQKDELLSDEPALIDGARARVTFSLPSDVKAHFTTLIA